jgi:hypothetical protein
VHMCTRTRWMFRLQSPLATTSRLRRVAWGALDPDRNTLRSHIYGRQCLIVFEDLKFCQRKVLYVSRLSFHNLHGGREPPIGESDRTGCLGVSVKTKPISPNNTRRRQIARSTTQGVAVLVSREIPILGEAPPFPETHGSHEQQH